MTEWDEIERGEYTPSTGPTFTLEMLENAKREILGFTNAEAEEVRMDNIMTMKAQELLSQLPLMIDFDDPVSEDPENDALLGLAKALQAANEAGRNEGEAGAAMQCHDAFNDGIKKGLEEAVQIARRCIDPDARASTRAAVGLAVESIRARIGAGKEEG